MSQTNLQIIRTVLDCLIRKSYLPEKFFQVQDCVLRASVEDFHGDYNRWFPNSESFDEDRLLTTPQLIVMLCYRIAHKINQLPPPPPPGDAYAADAFSLLGRQIGQIELFYSSSIGQAFKINHGVGTVVGARCIIGDNCTIHQNCTLGDRNGGRPSIGNNVIIYAGSMVLGNITIGDNSIIGANSVVTRSCPPGSVLIGSPARIIRTI